MFHILLVNLVFLSLVLASAPAGIIKDQRRGEFGVESLL
jgi:hypothetical protein